MDFILPRKRKILRFRRSLIYRQGPLSMRFKGCRNGTSSAVGGCFDLRQLAKLRFGWSPAKKISFWSQPPDGYKNLPGPSGKAEGSQCFCGPPCVDERIFVKLFVVFTTILFIHTVFSSCMNPAVLAGFPWRKMGGGLSGFFFTTSETPSASGVKTSKWLWVGISNSSSWTTFFLVLFDGGIVEQNTSFYKKS